MKTLPKPKIKFIKVAIREDEVELLHSIAAYEGETLSGIVREMLRSERHLPFDEYWNK